MSESYAATFLIHPKDLADLLANAVDVGKDKTTHPLICLNASGDSLLAYGRGRYMAGRDSRPFTADTPQYGEVVITEEEAAELASVLRKVEGVGRKGTTIDVVLTERQSFIVQNGPEDILCELPDADTNQISYGEPDELSDWEEIDQLLTEIKQDPHTAQPLAFTKDVLGTLNKIRTDSPVLDIASHPNGRVVGIALGSTFRALVAGVDRKGYANGGKWGDGPGRPDHLWEA